MTEPRWNGARWWKFDFHTHTPASSDYGKGPKQEELQKRPPKEWLLDYMRAGIDCVAVTDHNTGAWVDRLNEALGELEKEKPEGFRPLDIFPGVEISVNGGVHLLALLGRGKTTADIDSLLGAVGFPSADKGSGDAVTTKSFVEVVEAIAAARGIAISAHADGEAGFFRLQGTTLQQALECEDIFAMELADPDYQKPQLYIDRKLNWAEVSGSDAHHPAGNAGQRYPGSRFTWIKMGSPDIEGLRPALLDGRLSVKRSDRTDGDPNKHADSVIESIAVSKARYMAAREVSSLRSTLGSTPSSAAGARGNRRSSSSFASPCGGRMNCRTICKRSSKNIGRLTVIAKTAAC